MQLHSGRAHRGDRRDPWSGIELRGIFERLGWRCLEINGHDYSQIIPALEAAKASGNSDQPTMILAHTVMGHGVSYMADDYHWHGKPPKPDQAEVALKELGTTYAEWSERLLSH